MPPYSLNEGMPEHNTLGCVTESAEPQVDHGSGQIGKAHPTAACFIAAKRNAGGVLEAGERVLDRVALGVDRLVPYGRVEPPLLGGVWTVHP